MDEKPSVMAVMILKILARNVQHNFTLEELTAIVFNAPADAPTTDYNIHAQKIHQARVLETLLLLEDQQLVSLDSDTDQSCITAAGLEKIHS